MSELLHRTLRKSANGSTQVPDRAGILNAPLCACLLPPLAADEIGRLGDYRVLRLLGRGGMGYVFHAEDLTLRRPVALKVMKPDLDADPNALQRFLREARAMAAIKHESLVTVYQAGQENGAVFLAMELLAGMSLQDWLDRDPKPDPAQITRIGIDIACGLAAIHQHGLVHRDIKPGNIWLEAPNNRVKILDFGLARFTTDDAKLTQSGIVVGTPTYMSPEQARAQRVDSRSDLFSFGCVLYTMCTGTDPFHDESTTAVLTALAIKTPRSARQVNPAIPKALADLVAQLLEKNAEDRPASAESVIAELRRIEADRRSIKPTMTRPA
jgi:serine/threonine protein kinase